MKNVIILGSTGSIGTQTLEVIDKLDDYKVIGLSAGKNISLLKKQIEKYKPEIVSLQNEKDALLIKNEYKNVEVYFGEDGLIELSQNPKYDILVVATNSTVSLKATLKAIENKKRIALANKETLVMAGDIVMKKAKENNVEILPIDSEHSAILQCLNTKDNKFAKRLWITASGGPFLNSTREEMKNFRAKDALNHPNWAMGKKITIDCATLANKGLEIIEAHHLFDFDYENIKPIIHPQSIVHSFVEFVDGSVIAQMGLPSMHIPIQYALTYPKRTKGIKTDSFCLFNKTLDFYEPDFNKFPLLKYALNCAKEGGIMPAVFNASNEIAVYKFLAGEINFLEIEKIVFKQIEKTKNILNPSLDEIFEADELIRKNLKISACN